MRTATILLCLSGLALGFVLWQSGGDDDRAGDWRHPEPERLADEVPAGYEVLRFEVEGMCCESCPRTLRERLTAAAGVSDAAVSFREGAAEALVPVGADAAPLLEVLNTDKYTARFAR